MVETAATPWLGMILACLAKTLRYNAGFAGWPVGSADKTNVRPTGHVHEAVNAPPGSLIRS